MNAIEVEHISKAYSKVQAVKDVSFRVDRGELFGLIGPDGAGKTTLFRILTTLINADSGSASVDGFDVQTGLLEIRKRVGYMPGKFSLYPDLSVEENMNFFASLFGTSIQANYDLVAPIYRQIEPFKDRKAGKLSGGMKQKLALSCALIHKPSVLFLDEPTTGVDAVSRAEFWDMLANLKAQGLSILVSTPYMDEASRCDRIALINEGHVLTINTPQAIVSQEQQTIYALSGDDMFRLLTKARQYEDVRSCYTFGDTHHLTVNDHFDAQDFQYFMGGEVQLERIQPTIEDVFIQLMQHES